MIDIDWQDLSIRLSGHRWTFEKNEKGVLLFAGTLQYENQTVHNANDFGTCLDQVINHIPPTPEQLLDSFLPKTNGNFAFIIGTESQVIAVTDLIRSFPIYLAESTKRRILTDHISFNNDLTPDYTSVGSYIAAHYTIGQRTIFRGISSVSPGEVLILQPDRYPRRKPYFRFIYDPAVEKRLGDAELAAELDERLTQLFSRMIRQHAPDTQWVIPLSGGIDSRLIASYLAQLKARNVLCFSYGIPGNTQSALSKQVADSLNLKWEFIEYTEEKWYELHNNGLIPRFINYAFNGDSLPHLQDFLAISELKKRGLLSEKSCVVPGHNLGFIADYVLKDELHFHQHESPLPVKLTKKFYHHPTPDVHQMILEDINKSDIKPESYIEYFAWCNRHTKFTGNSVRVYEFFNLDWRLPYWERDIVDFWLSVDQKRRGDQKLYLYAAANNLLEPSVRDIPFAKKSTREKPLKKSKLLALISKKLGELPPNRHFHRWFGRSTHSDEGLTQIYARKGPLVEDMTGPLHQWPKPLQAQLKPLLARNTTRINYHKLTAIYTLWLEVFRKRLKNRFSTDNRL